MSMSLKVWLNSCQTIIFTLLSFANTAISSAYKQDPPYWGLTCDLFWPRLVSLCSLLAVKWISCETRHSNRQLARLHATIFWKSGKKSRRTSGKIIEKKNQARILHGTNWAPYVSHQVAVHFVNFIHHFICDQTRLLRWSPKLRRQVYILTRVSESSDKNT